MSWRPNSTQGVVLTAYHASSKGAAGSSAKDLGQVSPRSRKSGQYTMNRGNSNEKIAFNRSGSQDSLDDLSLEDYWIEVEDIKKNTDNSSQEEQAVVVKVPDEGEQEEEWLKEAGLSILFGESTADSQESMVFLSTLTRTQSAAVQKRIDTFTQTLRKKNKQHQIPDVRDVFRQPQELKKKDEDLNGFESTETKNGDLNDKSDCTAQNNDSKEELTVPEESPVPVTDINLEISFAEQASNLKEFSVVKNEKEDDSLLPNFRVPQDKTGITKVGDLAPQDMKKVLSLALIELTALFDVLGTDLKLQRAAKLKFRESGLFKVPLTTLLEQDQKRVPGTRVPLIFQSLIHHIENEGLDTEGILRIPGVSTRIKAQCQELEAKFYEGTFNWDTVKQHDAASLLKFFIRELPLPLLTVEYLKAFHSVQYLPTKKNQLQALNLLVILLPDVHRDTLKALLEFLQRVVDHREQNKMILRNVAMVMAPNLFTLHNSQPRTVDQVVLASAARTASVMLLMIKYQNLLWTIPKFIVGQVRQQNTANQKKLTKEKAMKKILKRMAYDREKYEKAERSLNDSDVPQGFIRVQAPQFSKVSMAIQLTEELKAGDILARFLSQDGGTSRNIKKEEVCLYEIGGNIGERCLEDGTYMKDLSQLNPSADWVIKPKSNV
ncbi:rho GTPase-activating protein 18 isoform X1 [Bombina bombina]|uniref:rho GTPase-activating protein 18 isoform X1 n=2 Tax=Bombina bombina TaxID=8345 RepID=UPI00235A5782|nr:rho GTPase-activating protein 18 isoform X1 [Bombina bombina]